MEHKPYQLNNSLFLGDEAQRDAFKEEKYLRALRREVKQDAAARECLGKEAQIADDRRRAGFFLLGDLRNDRNMRNFSLDDGEIVIVRERTNDYFLGLFDEIEEADEARAFDDMATAMDATMAEWGSNGERHFEFIPISIARQKFGSEVSWPEPVVGEVLMFDDNKAKDKEAKPIPTGLPTNLPPE